MPETERMDLRLGFLKLDYSPETRTGTYPFVGQRTVLTAVELRFGGTNQNVWLDNVWLDLIDCRLKVCILFHVYWVFLVGRFGSIYGMGV